MRARCARTPPSLAFLRVMRPPANSPRSISGAGSLLSLTSGCFSTPRRDCTSRATAYSMREGRKVYGPIRNTTTGTRTAAMTLRIALGRCPVFQIGVDESVEVAVEHPVHVRRLLARAVVLDELVGV